MKRGHQFKQEMKNEPQEHTQVQTNEGNSTAIANRAGGDTSSGAGYRGSLTGDTALDKGYSTYYHEYHPCHSRKVKQYALWWNFYRDVREDPPGDGDINIQKLNDFINALYGLTTTDTTGLWAFESPSASYNYTGFDVCSVENPYLVNYKADRRHNRRDPANMVKVIGLDFKVEDLIDNKLYDFTTQTGIFSLYYRYRLESFTIEICPKSYNQSALDANPSILCNVATKPGFQGGAVCPLYWPPVQELLTYNQAGGDELQTTGFSADAINLGDNNNCREVDMDYWVYRDVYNEEADAEFNIPVNLELNCKQLRNYDNNMSIMSNKEPFKFTRKVNTKASYFVPKAQLGNLKEQNLSAFINVLEGITSSDQTVAPLTEGFNFLVVPCNPQFQSFCAAAPKLAGAGDSIQRSFVNVILPRLHTKLYVKVTARWEAFDYIYDTQNPGKKGRIIESESQIKEIHLREVAKMGEMQRMNKLIRK